MMAEPRVGLGERGRRGLPERRKLGAGGARLVEATAAGLPGLDQRAPGEEARDRLLELALPDGRGGDGALEEGQRRRRTPEEDLAAPRARQREDEVKVGLAEGDLEVVDGLRVVGDGVLAAVAQDAEVPAVHVGDTQLRRGRPRDLDGLV